VIEIGVHKSVDDVHNLRFCLSRLFLEPFRVTGHGLARTAAAKEKRNVPLFDAFRPKNTE